MSRPDHKCKDMRSSMNFSRELKYGMTFLADGRENEKVKDFELTIF